MATNATAYNNPALPGATTQMGGIPGAASPSGLNPNLLGTGGTGGILGSLFGEVPGVSNPLASAQDAISGNRGNLQDLANLTYGTDTISNAAAATGLESNLPNYENMLGSAVQNTSSDLAGQLPQDVINQITQEGAERGIATGQGGNSPNANASMLQDLGLTSLDLQNTGMSNLSTLIGETPQGAQFNPASMFVTPEQEQSANQATQNAMAAPDPAASGIFSSIMSLI
jgi:hypothetical protein